MIETWDIVHRRRLRWGEVSSGSESESALNTLPNNPLF